MSAYWFALRSAHWQLGQPLASHNPLYLQATTACLSAIVVMQVANVFLCRSDRRSAFLSGFFSNKLILAGIAIEITLIALIDDTPWGNALFGTAPISVAVWLIVVPFALAMLAIEETRKWIVRQCKIRLHSPPSQSFRGSPPGLADKQPMKDQPSAEDGEPAAVRKAKLGHVPFVRFHH